MATKVFTMHARLDKANAAVLREALWQQNQYRNTLTKIERDRLATFRTVRRSFSPRLDVIEAELAELEELRQSEGELDADQKERRKVLSAEAKPLRAAFKASRAPGVDAMRKAKKDRGEVPPRTAERINAEILDALVSDPSMPPEWVIIARSDAEAHELHKREREKAGIAQCLYAPADDADEQSRGKLRGRDPKFRRFTGEGRIAVQVRKDHGVTSGGAITFSDTGVEITPVAYRNGHRPRTGERNQRQFYAVRLRLTKDRDPQQKWIELSAMAHRPVPAGTLAWVQLVARKCGNQLTYQLQLVMSSESFAPRPTGTGDVAVHIGWASNSDGTFQVAHAVGSDGQERVLALDMRRTDKVHGQPRYDVSGFGMSQSLRSAGDQHFNAARRVLATWLQSKANRKRAGAELLAASQHIGLWKSPRKLHKAAACYCEQFSSDAELTVLWKAWVTERLATKLDLFGPRDEIEAWAAGRGVTDADARLAWYLLCWRRKSSHLYDYERHEARQARGRRKDQFRCFARWLANGYARVLIAEWDLTQIPGAAKRGSEEDAQTKAARANRVRCAPGELRATIIQAVGENACCKVDTKGLANQCSRCGKVSRAPEDRQLVSCACGMDDTKSRRWCANVLRIYAGKEAA
jgi:hypothetical protein